MGMGPTAEVEEEVGREPQLGRRVLVGGREEARRAVGVAARQRRRRGHALAVAQRAAVEVVGREGADGRVHAVLRAQQVRVVAAALQPLEEGGVVAAALRLEREHRRGQLLRVAHLGAEGRGGV